MYVIVRKNAVKGMGDLFWNSRGRVWDAEERAHRYKTRELAMRAQLRGIHHRVPYYRDTFGKSWVEEVYE